MLIGDLEPTSFKGWQEEKLDEHFDARLTPKGIIRAPTTKTLQEWFYAGRDVMKELDSNIEIVPTGGPFEFLDLWYVLLCSTYMKDYHDSGVAAHLVDSARISSTETRLRAASGYLSPRLMGVTH